MPVVVVLYRLKRHLGLVASLVASKAVEGAGIPTSTTVVSITSTTIVISQNANANNSSASLRICPWGNGDGSTTFNVPDHRYRTVVGRDNINNYPASRSSDFAGTHLSTTGGEEMHQLVTNEAVGRSGLDRDFAGICLVPA
jgi:hypothetical protein